MDKKRKRSGLSETDDFRYLLHIQLIYLLVYTALLLSSLQTVKIILGNICSSTKITSVKKLSVPHLKLNITGF